jgi:hypothetical protein
MKIVSVSQTQTFKYIPRVFACENYIERVILDGGGVENSDCLNETFTYILTDEQTNKSETITAATSSDGNYLTASMTFGSSNAPFREGHFYTLEVLDGSTLIYRDKLFCTAQTPVTQSRYNVNKDVYDTNDTHNNDYIVL